VEIGGLGGALMPSLYAMAAFSVIAWRRSARRPLISCGWMHMAKPGEFGIMLKFFWREMYMR